MRLRSFLQKMLLVNLLQHIGLILKRRVAFGTHMSLFFLIPFI